MLARRPENAVTVAAEIPDQAAARVLPTRPTDLLALRDVSKTYRAIDRSDIVALSPTNLAIRPGEFVTFVGPSGCGKTTLLNIISGLIRPTTGEITFAGQQVAGPTGEMSLVFQRPVLLPWRRILDNVMLPAEVMNLRPRAAFEKKARELLTLVGLVGFDQAYPRELSGGMQQRAAIARALVADTRVLLMDEPFAALDAMTREELNIELMRIWELTGRTIVFVTHNIAEAVLLSDRIIVMTARPGRVRAIIDVSIPRPRTLATMGEPEFGTISNRIRGMLHNHSEEPVAR